MAAQDPGTRFQEHMFSPSNQLRLIRNIDTTQEIRQFHHYMVFLIRSGRCTLYINGEVYHGESGQIILVRPGDHFLFKAEDNPEPMSGYEICIGIDCARIWKTYQKIDTVLCFHSSFFQSNRIVPLDIEDRLKLESICETCINDTEDEFGNEVFESSLIKISYILVNRICRKYEMTYKGLGDSLALKVQRYIDNYLGEDLSIKKLASIFYVNDSHLMHSFKKHTGMSIHQYTLERRLGNAKELLEHGEKPSVVYVRCGFRDYTSFFRQFKAEYGVSPRDFCNELHKDKQE